MPENTRTTATKAPVSLFHSLRPFNGCSVRELARRPLETRGSIIEVDCYHFDSVIKLFYDFPTTKANFSNRATRVPLIIAIRCHLRSFL